MYIIIYTRTETVLSFRQDLYTMVGTEYFPPTGMENQGLSTYQLSSLAASLDTHTDSEAQANQQLVAHEYLHEWSGGFRL
jgi:aminopeptidase N